MCRHTKQTSFYLLLFLSLEAARAHTGYGPGKQDWSFVDVRPGAHMFYWLYYTTAANVQHYTDRPLVIWLQGGPGISSAFGNFLEFGVVDQNNNTRNTTWIQHVNVLFVDSPVGCGYSYVDDVDLLAKNNKQIASDLVSFLKQFYVDHAEFRAVPLHIIGESYAGKMAPEFGLALHKAQDSGDLKCKLLSISLVSPWTSPLDAMYAWPATLLQLGIIEQTDYRLLRAKVDETKVLVKQHDWSAAMEHWAKVEHLIVCITKGIDFYNIIKYLEENDFINCTVENGTVIGDYYYKLPKIESDLQNSMRNEVAHALNITNGQNFQIQSDEVFTALAADFMRSAVHIVRQLLDSTSISVNIITGQLDLICAPAGIEKWIERMKWREKSKYLQAKRAAIVVDGQVVGYAKRAGNFNVYWVNRAGHMVAADNPIAMNHILHEMLAIDAL